MFNRQQEAAVLTETCLDLVTFDKDANRISVIHRQTDNSNSSSITTEPEWIVIMVECCSVLISTMVVAVHSNITSSKIQS